MHKDEFLERVNQRVDLDSESTERISTAVLLTLRSRLSPEEITDISYSMPQDLDELWEGGWLQRLISRLQSFREMDEDEFLEQVREAADLRTIPEAREATEAVFSALKDAIPSTEVDHISHELPRDLRDFWEAA